MIAALKTRESIRIERQAGQLGAYVYGLDLTRQLSSAVREQLRTAILEHLVICVRGQNISPEDQIRFAEIFGEIFVHPYVKGIEGHPKVLAIHRPNSATEVWHSDTTHSECPPRYTVLAARILPQYGGTRCLPASMRHTICCRLRCRRCLGACARSTGTTRLGRDSPWASTSG
ncbi:MAG: hypothetical protein FJY55_04040 [Betaproteobacteria bacterium]|nr:hypothetical protein [Betaproteobacteria bacterium]